MREKYIEQKLVREVKKRGGLCEKWNSGSSGWPDRLVLLPDGKFGLVEVKASGKKPRVLQEHRHDQLRSLGYKVFVLDDAGQIGGILDLMGVVDENQTVKDFDLVNNSSNLNWTFRSQVTKFIKRFIKDPYRNEDTEWIRKLSETYEFSIKAKLSALSKLL